MSETTLGVASRHCFLVSADRQPQGSLWKKNITSEIKHNQPSIDLSNRNAHNNHIPENKPCSPNLFLHHHMTHIHLCHNHPSHHIHHHHHHPPPPSINLQTLSLAFV